jgi:hypothetical protein
MMETPLFMATMSIVVLIIVMSVIQIALVIINDAKVWSKLDRIVSFFMSERNSIINAIEDINQKLIEIEKKISNKPCNQ